MAPVVASAPGKVILVGEYAVLEGAPAVSVAVNRRARATLTLIPGFEWEVVAPEAGCAAASFRIAEDGAPRWAPGTDTARALALVDATLNGLARDGFRLPVAQAYRLRLDTSAFFSEEGGARQKLGLGSSAALTVAMAAALARVASGPGRREAPPPLDRLLQWHRDFQGGRGSGVDVGTSLAGGTVIYQLDACGAGATAESAHWPRGLRVLFVWSGRSASTPQFLARLSAWRHDHAAEYAERMAALAAHAAAAAAAVRGEDAGGLIAAAARFSACLHGLGAASGVDIVSAEHARIGAIAAAETVFYKPCGAGGGDLGVALALEDAPLARLRSRLDTAGFRCIDLAPDPVGLRLDGDDAG